MTHERVIAPVPWSYAFIADTILSNVSSRTVRPRGAFQISSGRSSTSGAQRTNDMTRSVSELEGFILHKTSSCGGKVLVPPTAQVI